MWVSDEDFAASLVITDLALPATSVFSGNGLDSEGTVATLLEWESLGTNISTIE